MGNLMSKKELAKKKTDFNHGKANNLTGNHNKPANTSQGLGPTQLLSHQLEPSNGNEAMLTRMHQVPAVDAPQNKEQSIHKAENNSQDADPVKCIPELPSAVRVTQQYMSIANSKDNKTSAPKPELQQATPVRPTAGPCDGAEKTAGQPDASKSDISRRLQDVPSKLSQQQSLKPSAQAQKQKKHQIKQKVNRWVKYGYTKHKEATESPLQTRRTVAPCDCVHNPDASASVQVPAQVLCKDTSSQVECSFWSNEQQEMIPQLPASNMQPPVHLPWKRKVRGENLHCKDAETQRKKISCVLSPVKEESTDLNCHPTYKVHDIAVLNTTTDIVEMPAAMPTKPPDDSSQSSSQPKAQVDNEENALHNDHLNLNSVINATVAYLFHLNPKSENGRANAAKMRLRQKRANRIKDQPGDCGKSSVSTVHESSQKQDGTGMEENTPKKHNESHQIPQPNKSDNGNTCIQKVKVKAPASQVPVVEGLSRTATHDPTTDTNIRILPHDTSVRPKTKCTLKAFNQNQPKNTGKVTMEEEMNGQVEREEEPPISSAVTLAINGRWYPFTVNQSCSKNAHCRHNPGTGLPANVQNWFNKCLNHPYDYQSETHQKHNTKRGRRQKRFSSMRNPKYERLKDQYVEFDDV